MNCVACGASVGGIVRPSSEVEEKTLFFGLIESMGRTPPSRESEIMIFVSLVERVRKDVLWIDGIFWIWIACDRVVYVGVNW